MTMSSKKRRAIVRKVLEETNYAYMLSCETQHMNSDYADYAGTHSLTSFQRALKDPNLTYEELCKILRRASTRESGRQCKTPWSLFMANYIDKHSNTNIGQS